MKLLRQTPSTPLFVAAAIVVVLTLCEGLARRFKEIPALEPTAAFHLSLAITPTPYPLPTQSYDSPPYVATILGQVFGSRNRLPDPSQLLQGAPELSGDKHLGLYVQDDHFAVDLQWWQQEAKPVYDYVSHRLDTTLDNKVTVALVPPQTGNCAPRGTTFQEEQPVILIFADQDTSKEQILATLAHELAHVFIHKKYEAMTDVALTEGMATWAAGDYWQAWKGVEWDTAMRSYIDGDAYLSLFQNYDMRKAYDDRPGCIASRDILLTEFASFVGYLIRTRGTTPLSALCSTQRDEWVNSQRVVYPPNYSGVYGSELNQLEQEWLKALLYDSSQ
jgi:hypothetical protein